uniref:BTB domain-containing protein n=1 Tax=Daphnia galeata TaxID=27404 RepID=A0A8J2VZR0_9CRUS|nr:unnamed protein product [Daphnia galeata]
MDAVDRLKFYDLRNRFQIKTGSNNQTDDGMTRLFLGIQPKLKSRDQLAVEIRENDGRISETGRGLCMHFDYIRTFRSGESVPPEVFRFDRKGFFGVTLIENQQKNGHNLSTDIFQFPFGRRFQIVYLAEMDECWGYRLHDPRLPAQFWSSTQRGDLTDVQLRQLNSCHLFPVHRAILSARNNERLSIIDIGEDLDPDVFDDFLVFIYTGRLRTAENMAELWAAANK